jgi:hypothetical protein
MEPYLLNCFKYSDRSFAAAPILQWRIAMVETMSRMQQRPTEEAKQHSEGPVARTIEQQTAKLPSDLFLWAALGSMGVSLMLRLTDHKDQSLFVGQWAAPFLIMGMYNKLVKVAGSDRVHDKAGAAY